MAGEPDPTELRCRYCWARVQIDGAGRLWEYRPDAGGGWERQEDGLLWWRDDAYTDRCPLSPTFAHQAEPMDRLLSGNG
jgi:hypothetical protein